MRISYGGAHVMKTQSQTVLEAMCNATGTNYASADYRLPVPDAWTQELDATLAKAGHTGTDKPVCVYRPLVARPEWRGSMVRNADPGSYAELFSEIRNQFYVISVADLEVGREWIVGPQLKADLTLHQGELTFEALASLFEFADLVWTSSGFGAILAPAVGTPCVSVLGGYEGLHAHSSALKFAPYLVLGPDTPCSCWTSQCRRPCNKSINMLNAGPALGDFMYSIGQPMDDRPKTPFDEMFGPANDPIGRPPATPFSSTSSQLLLAQQRMAARAHGLKA
jgi:hypothetical protein